MTEKPIRVAKVIDEFTVVLNCGSEQGITTSDKFLIFGIGEEIVDPTSGDSLGILEQVRGTVKVFHVQERLCQAKSNQVLKKPVRKKLTPRFGVFFEREEIVDDVVEIELPLNDPKIGDFAKQY